MVAKNSSSSNNLPPGFRFHPTDEELMMHYLRNQVRSKPCPVSIIPEVDIYKFDPWELPEKTQIGENEWYFFSPRDRKYPNGLRPNRAAVSGYWKATGTDKAIYSGSKKVGVKKALVFYKGRPPKGVKTDWIMHEYRLSDQSTRAAPSNKHSSNNGSMRLDDWVLCRIYKKKSVIRQHCEEQQQEEEEEQRVVLADGSFADQKTEAICGNYQGANMEEFKFPRTCSLTHLWEFGYMGLLPQLTMDENTAYNNNNNYVSFDNNGNGQESLFSCNNSKSSQLWQACPEAAVKFEVINDHHQSIFENPVYHLE